jgi:hypothetical protein
MVNSSVDQLLTLHNNDDDDDDDDDDTFVIYEGPKSKPLQTVANRSKPFTNSKQ